MTHLTKILFASLFLALTAGCSDDKPAEQKKPQPSAEAKPAAQASAPKKLEQSLPLPQQKETFKKLDTNQDNKLTYPEAKAILDIVAFKALDKNGDEVLVIEEFLIPVDASGKPVQPSAETGQ